MTKQILRAYKYRLLPEGEEQLTYLSKTFGCVRFTWNKLVEHFNSWTQDSSKETLNLTRLKSEYEWLRDVCSCSLQQKENDFKSTKSQFFNKKRKVKLGRMKFKNKNGRQSFRLSKGDIVKKELLNDGLIKLPKIDQPFKFINHRPFTGQLRSVTISKNPDGKYFISCLVLEDYTPKPRTGKAVGIDLGLKDLLTLSNGVKFQHPKFQLEKTNRAIKLTQKKMSRKIKGSNNREKLRLKLVKLYSKQTNIKKNYYHEISNYIVTNFDEIFMEDLNVSGMLKNRKLSRVIHEASWSTLKSMIEYKSSLNQRNFHRIDRWFPSSKTCSSCGHKMESMELSIRRWVCSSCGSVHDRDLNAAVNILNEGQRNCYNEIIYSSVATIEGEVIPMTLMKHSSKIERSGVVDSVGMRME